ncbi:integrin beta pat-3 [Trichinella spiralis]|uniref:Integrin beta n=1 Tax=Trichinella spiralis TaxID=6334 RepID=E5SPE4_TRISP|nr:integrin beta pat-3 [Trichinella spiralis]KRY41314.1 Integrin beta pat-3 [Trichinella spiralis]
MALWLAFVLFTVRQVFAQSSSSSSSFPCHALSGENYTCEHCISQHPSCTWCTMPGFDENNRHSRCDTSERLLYNGCHDEFIENPKTEYYIARDEPLSNAGETEEESEAIQLKPQEILISMRPKDVVSFDVTFRQALDYPVDLYYLMDLSFSMADDKQKLTELGDLLSERMRKITKNFRLGFGSYVDKKVMPFVDARPERASKPCETCVDPYGFKNHMTLTKDTRRFAKEVNESAVSGNLDAPEGGFDAIMQALTCTDKIGWREKSRKMIVFSTDAGFHYAGDGRLGGLVVPNDGNCHLDNDGYYSVSTEFDYPSISQVYQKIRETQANMIFAVTEEQVPLYQRLRGALPEISASVGKLANDSSNVVELVQEQYDVCKKMNIINNNFQPRNHHHRSVMCCRKFHKKLSWSTTSTLRRVFKFPTLQHAKGRKVMNRTNVCDGIKVGDTITFNLTLEVTQCTDQREFLIKIGPSGLSEVLLIRLNVLCDCDCSSKQLDSLSRAAEYCNYNGDLVCGVCQCHHNRVGRRCECEAPGMSTAALDMMCRKNNDTRAPICEGRGDCDCGRCVCYKRENINEVYSGQFCECDNFNCPRHKKKLCAGHGECVCQQCKCDPGWVGRACECPISQDSCIASNGKICNGRGVCECGVCKCFTDPEGIRYSGPTCEICPTCPTKCIEYKPCVMCQQFKTGPYNESMCAQCPFTVIPVDELPESNNTGVKCQFVDQADDCTFYFMYELDEDTNNVTVWVRKEKDCPPPVPVLAIVLGVIAGIVLIGLILLLIWKLLTIIHDRREYAKFEKERLMAKWDTGENPIFHPATTTFKNPAYGGNKLSNDL